MSAPRVTKKRKSAEAARDSSVKRARMVKSGEKPAPLKSALKKPRPEGSETTVPPPKQVQKTEKAHNKSGKSAPTKAIEDTRADKEDENELELTPDQTADLLAGFSSSEDEADSEDENGISISSIPKAPTTGAVQKRIRQAISEQDDPENTPGVIYIGRIPHGFYEPQMTAYLSQFGEILNVRLARNKKTGRGQHHGFVQFASAAVADIVVKTMDKYLLFGHVLQVRRVPKAQVKKNMFKGSGRRKKPAPRNKLEGGKLRRGATREVWAQRVEKENLRRLEKAEKLKEMGYEFYMPIVKDVAIVPVKSQNVAVIEDVNGAKEVPEDMEAMLAIAADAVVPEQTVPQNNVVRQDTIVKKRSASGKTESKRVSKKIKT